jgi:uncharacterized membrane protein YkvA (DUF1232 family)
MDKPITIDNNKTPRRKLSWKKAVILLLAAVYIISPFDLLPEALLGPIGYLDDLGVLAWAIKQALKKED